MLYRLVNNTTWFESIGGVFSNQDWLTNREHWVAKIRKAPKPHSPAYIVLQAPGNFDGRAAQLIRILDRMWKTDAYEQLQISIHKAKSLEEVWKVLQRPYGMGPFIALQVFRDLLLFKALPFEENDFTYLGPGAREGLKMLFPQVDTYKEQYAKCISLFENQPDWLDPPLVLGDVEHCLCETAKYWKFREGRGRRRKYKPHV